MILAIDPGPVQSAWLYLLEGRPVQWGIYNNVRILTEIIPISPAATLGIEMIASYGMPVGAEIFETAVWSGRFIQRWADCGGGPVQRVYRREVKAHLCHSARAKDSNVRQALIDRYGPGKAAAIGVKASPGPLYGVTKDVWAALAVAVTVADNEDEPPQNGGSSVTAKSRKDASPNDREAITP